MCRGNLFGNFKMCRGKELLVNAVGSHICNNVVRWLIDPSRTAGADKSVFSPDFCNSSRNH